MSESNNKINSIQLLRAVAVLLVVHCHIFDIQKSKSLQLNFFHLKNFGAAGVDIFFVISGFIITIVAGRYAANKQGAYFFLKRFLRIMPLYWLVCFLFAFLLYFHNGKVYNTASIAATIVIWPFYKAPVTTELVLSQAWTLYFELFFYTVTSIALTFGGKRYVITVILLFSFLIALGYYFGGNIAILTFCGNGIMIEFLMGVLIAVLFSSSFTMPSFVANIILVAGILFFATTLFMGYGNISESYNILDGSASLRRSLIWGTPSMLVVAGLIMKEKNGRLVISPIWIYIGNASFSIYLIHLLILSSLYVRWVKWNLQNKVPPDMQVVISLAIVVLLGCAFYRLVEQPLLNKIHRLTRFLRRRPASSSTTQI